MHDKASPDNYEEYRRILEASGRFRVIARFVQREHYHRPAEGERLRKAAFVDVETTGLDRSRELIIELGVVLFSYAVSGQVVQIIAEYGGFDDPGIPIPPHITQLTGITDEMVRGQRLDEARLKLLFAEADLIIAHNAAFDRPFVERRLSGLDPSAAGVISDDKPWACSQREVPWREHGFESAKLEFLAYRYGLFYDGHRALDDCRIAVHLLAQPLPGAATTALCALLTSARKPSHRLWAVGSPYETKALLKARRYHWDQDERCWRKEVSADELEAETAFLQNEVLAGQTPKVEMLTARERYR